METKKEHPVYDLVAAGKWDDVVRVMEAEPNVPAKQNGRTPLHEAVGTAPFSAVQSMIRAGASVSARDHELQTPLHLAAVNGRSDLISWLVRHSAEPWTRDKNGNTPLAAAALANASET